MKWKTGKYTPSEISMFRQKWLKKGYELINITEQLIPKLGLSGWCNDFSEPEEQIYHIQLWYRDEQVAVLSGKEIYTINDDKFLVFLSGNKQEGHDFIIFRKVKV